MKMQFCTSFFRSFVCCSSCGAMWNCTSLCVASVLSNEIQCNCAVSFAAVRLNIYSCEMLGKKRTNTHLCIMVMMMMCRRGEQENKFVNINIGQNRKRDSPYILICGKMTTALMHTSQCNRCHGITEWNFDAWDVHLGMCRCNAITNLNELIEPVFFVCLFVCLVLNSNYIAWPVSSGTWYTCSRGGILMLSCIVCIVHEVTLSTPMSWPE